MKKILVILGLLILMVSCDKEDFIGEPDSKMIDFEKFTLKTPPNWERFYPQGTDGFYGGLTNKNDTLYFDYGPFAFASVDDIENTDETISFERLVVDSYDSKIIKRSQGIENQIFIGFYTDKRDDENLNSIYSYNPKDEKTLREIFLAHRFK